jgi:tetraacyldisaccharide 4'-kinase
MVPLLPLYAAGAVFRMLGQRPKRLAWPVISVGNLSAGGTGKTPFTIALAKLLVGEGFVVDVLSRGYGRSATTVERVDPDGSAERFGDEPLLITREARVPVYVAARRFEAGVLAEDAGREAGPSTSLPHPSDKDLSPGTPVRSAQDDNISFDSRDASDTVVHLLDDGFQHRQLARQVDIVLVNSEDLNDWLLPAGNLREPLSALRRATVFAVPVGDDEAIGWLRKRDLEQPVWRYRREMTVPDVAGSVVAFCGIARPEQFFAGLTAAGVNVVARHAFRDHHRFDLRDFRMLIELVKRTGATALVTTEKDRVRLGSLEAEFPDSIPVVTAGLRIVLEDESGIAAWLRKALGRSV